MPFFSRAGALGPNSNPAVMLCCCRSSEATKHILRVMDSTSCKPSLQPAGLTGRKLLQACCLVAAMTMVCPGTTSYMLAPNSTMTARSMASKQPSKYENPCILHKSRRAHQSMQLIISESSIWAKSAVAQGLVPLGQSPDRSQQVPKQQAVPLSMHKIIWSLGQRLLCRRRAPLSICTHLHVWQTGVPGAGGDAPCPLSGTGCAGRTCSRGAC